MESDWIMLLFLAFLYVKIMGIVYVHVCPNQQMYRGACLRAGANVYRQVCADLRFILRILFDCSSTLFCWSRLFQSNPELTEMAGLTNQLASGINYICLPELELGSIHCTHTASSCVLGTQTPGFCVYSANSFSIDALSPASMTVEYTRRHAAYSV